jgi:hypothetical protein
VADDVPEQRTLDDSKGRRVLELIRILRNPATPDEDADALLNELEKLLAHPGVSDLLFWRTPELTDEEVVEEALRHHPFIG